MGEGGARPRWLYVIVPYYAIQSSIGSFVRLYILDLGGSVIDVGLASSAFTIALIPSAYLGGKLADFLGRRRPILVLSAAGQLVSVVVLTLSTSIPPIIGLYALFSFFGSFAPPIFSLLLVETLSKDRWGEGSAHSFRFMIYGSTLGLALSATVLVFMPLRSVSLLPMSFSTLMLAFCLAVLRDPPVTLERRTIAFSSDTLIGRLAHLPVILLRLPKAIDFKMLARSWGHALTRDIPLIMMSSALFLLGANLFFTSYTPYLKSNDLSYLEIVGLDLFVSVINGLASSKPFKEISKKGDPGVLVEFLSLRAIAFLLGAVTSLYFTGRPVMYITLLLYLLIGIAYTNITIGINSLLYKYLPSGKQGGTLGVYSSINSIAMFLGSLLSGTISYYLGYSITFLLSSIALFGAASMLEWHFKPRRYEEEEPI